MARALQDDEPAFPRDWAHPGHNGMSLRDRFAIAAMAAAFPNGFPAHVRFGIAAREAYQYADAMLAERVK